MVNLEDFMTIKPNLKGLMRFSNDYYQEFDIFKEKFKTFFPKFPDEVIRQWPYEHFSDFAGEVRWEIGYDRLEFQKDILYIDDFRVLAAERFDNATLLEMGETHLNDDEYVARYVRKHLTYPTPIIILDSANSNLEGDYAFEMPYHILEGHRRSWLMRALIETGNPLIPQKHEIWMTRRK